MKKLKINVKLLWLLSIGSTVFTTTAVLGKLMHWPHLTELFLIGVTLCTFTTIFLLIDIAKNKVYNKFFWLISIIILPTIAPIAYLIQRDHLVSIDKE